MARSRPRPSRQAANAANAAISSQQREEKEALSNPRSKKEATGVESPSKQPPSSHSFAQAAPSTSSEDMLMHRKHVSPEPSLPERPQKRQAQIPRVEKLIEDAIVDCESVADQAHASGDFDQWPRAKIAEEKAAHLIKIKELVVSQAYRERLEQTQESHLLGDKLESQVAEEMMNRTAEAEAYLIAYVNCLMRNHE